ncbi:MAG: hypothetical protein IKH57_10150 [Clostridia bacterium]|nr:hypothetical protein [Clostridia bacterium]
MKKFVCLLLITVLALGCVSAASASLSAYYKDGKIYVSNSGTGMTRINMNGSSTGYFLGGSNTTVVLTPPAGATSVTISGVVDPAFGGDGGTVTVNISGGGTITSAPVTSAPTGSPITPTGSPITPTGSPVTPTGAPLGPSVSAGNYVNGTVTVSAAGINTPSAIYIDNVPTGISIDQPGSRAIKVGNLTPGTHTVQLYTWTGVVSSTFTVSSGPTPTTAPHTHSWGGWTVIKGASCEGSGEQTHTCTTCGATETQRISPLGHRYVVESENDRYTNYRCSNCGKHMQKEKIVYASPTPAMNPYATQSPGLTTVTRNAFGHILWDSNAMAVDYDSYRDVQDITTVIIEVAQDTRSGRPTEIGLYLDGELVNTLKGQGYATLRYINGDAILNISLSNLSDAWFDTEEAINFRIFTTDPKAAGGVLVKVEAELGSGSVIQPSKSLTGIVLKGATDILVAQNGVYDIAK